MEKQDSIKSALAEASKVTDTRVQMYYRLCDLRDSVNAKVKPLQAKLDEACAVTIAAQEKERAIAAEIEAVWGPDWIALKKQIADLARSIGKIPAR